MTIHWCGTGLSSVPGLRRLIEAGHEVAVWNRTVERAQKVVGDLTGDIRPFTLEALAAALRPGDVAVSMLPADLHVAIATACLSNGAHFVSSSYVAPEMAALDDRFRAAGLVCVNEVGLDPGIDHLMAHDLVARYRTAPDHHADNILSFTSYCGGVPKQPNPFRYKFSWSPLGVLKALRAPSRSLADFADRRVARPWDAISRYEAPLPVPESFEVYPNRDSLPFLTAYRFDPAWQVRDFVRGTIRLDGWAKAWAPVFAEIETLQGSEGDARLAEMAADFWRDNAYGTDEPDRVVLFVSLRAERAGRDGRSGRAVWHETWVLDAWGDARGTAMARLVSVPVALAVEAVLAGDLPAGVQAAPHDPALVTRWLTEVADLAQVMARIDQAA